MTTPLNPAAETDDAEPIRSYADWLDLQRQWEAVPDRRKELDERLSAPGGVVMRALRLIDNWDTRVEPDPNGWAHTTTDDVRWLARLLVDDLRLLFPQLREPVERV
jgi:hypothetical protein